MPPKNENTSLAEAIASLTESMNLQMQELKISQENLTSKLDHTIADNQSSLKTLQSKITQLENSSSSLQPFSTLMEQYFAFYSVEPHQRLPIVAFFMSGEALCWYQWMYRNRQLVDWDSFAQALEDRFDPSLYLNPSAALFKLKQQQQIPYPSIHFSKIPCSSIHFLKTPWPSTTKPTPCFTSTTD
ncbi:hypothetical protein COLO4_38135 [Corchorus olitorius]|uniref:Retrotransposon gag protein n=1 Tax=Corchorus olitorius TaxID=93759 RepID=A0A1R3FWS0_9ROSI|nr:hypothetical protein COLO4_38135 [Corchorus olitorius]